MFHRVKSEDVQDNQQEQASPAENQKPMVEDTPREDKTEDSTNTSTSNQTKEESPMNAQAEDNNSKNEQAEQPRTRSFENYQRQPGRAAPGGYPGAYPGSSYAAPAAGTAAEKVAHGSSDRTLTIGAGISMSGEIEACDQLIVEGTIEASLKGARILDVTETGTFYGTVEIDEAVIAGRFEGDLTVNGRLVVRQGGVISGTISYRELEVEAGAVIEGKMTPLKAEPQVEAAAPRPKVMKEMPVAKAAADSKGQTPPPANMDGQGLFADKAVAAE